jgi:hypothetical protein
MNLRVPQNAGKFFSGCTIGSFSRWAQLHQGVSDYYYHYTLLLTFTGEMKGKRQLGDTNIDRRTILKCIYNKQDIRIWIQTTWLRIATVADVKKTKMNLGFP